MGSDGGRGYTPARSKGSVSLVAHVPKAFSWGSSHGTKGDPETRWDGSQHNREESEDLSRWIRPSETEAAIRKFPLNTNPALDNLTGEFYQTFWNDLTPLLLKLSQKI